MTKEEDMPWYAGAIGRIPEDDSLVYREDAVFGPQFYARSPHDAGLAAQLLNEAEHRGEQAAFEMAAKRMEDIAQMSVLVDAAADAIRELAKERAK